MPRDRVLFALVCATLREDTWLLADSLGLGLLDEGVFPHSRPCRPSP